MIINIIRKKIFTKRILNFIYNLRYLISIFIFSIILLFTTPKLFKYVNKINELNKIFKNQHGFIIKNTDNIEYKIFPQPNLEIRDTSILINEQFSNIKLKEVKIFTNLKGLFVAEKIIFKKIKFKGNLLGNDITGHYVPRKKENLLYFEFKNLGIESKVFLDNQKKIPKFSGKMKLKILNDNVLLNFNFDQSLTIKKSVFKNKNILSNFNGKINFDPFFYFNILIDIKKVNFENLKLKKIYQLILNEISNNKLNGELVVNYFTKKENNQINLKFNNGDIASNNSFFEFANLNFKTNFYLRKYPLYKNLNYELIIQSENINELFKIIDIKKNKNLKKVKILVKGKINLDAQKYYFDKIIINEKVVEGKKLIKFKNYLEEKTINYLNNNVYEKNMNLFFKDLIEFILA